MANLFGYGASNQSVINQLIRQKENIDNMIQQYSQQQQQPPVQNIINTTASVDFEARILKEGETPENTFVHRRTMFLDRKNRKLCVKEIDGSISESYDVVIPLDEKDQKIQELERQLKEANEQKDFYIEQNNNETEDLKAQVEQLKQTIEKLKEQPKAKKS